MPAMSDLISIGAAILRVRGLNPQSISTMSEARMPGRGTWVGTDYQDTGLGEAHTRIAAVTYPHVIGGLDMLAVLQAQHEARQVVNYIRLSDATTFLGRAMGRVRIRNLVVEETHLHPIDGVGRKVGVEFDLLYIGEPNSAANL